MRSVEAFLAFMETERNQEVCWKQCTVLNSVKQAEVNHNVKKEGLSFFSTNFHHISSECFLPPYNLSHHEVHDC